MQFLSHISADWVSAIAAALTILGGVILLIVKLSKFSGAILQSIDGLKTNWPRFVNR